MSKRKVIPGRCGTCGCAVPQPPGLSAAEREWGCTDGHYYSGGKLEKVRCHLHVDKNDSRTPGYGWS